MINFIKRAFLYISLFLAVVHFVFIADIMREDSKCYSPNHEYYIVRKYPLINLPDGETKFSHRIGIVELYDKTGKLLYSNEAIQDYEAGPLWGQRSVFYMGASPGERGGDWEFELPTYPGREAPLAPGEIRGDRVCF